MRKIATGTAAFGILAVLAVTVPAWAHDDDDHGWHRRAWHDHGWREHGWHEWREHHWRPYPPGYVVPRYYAVPPPVYYAPPPVYYAPPPVVYSPPGVSVGIGLNFR